MMRQMLVGLVALGLPVFANAGSVCPWPAWERFKAELDAYIVHWNTRRRQIRLEGRTPEEFRSMSLAV